MGQPSLQLTSGTFDRIAAQQELFSDALIDMAVVGGGTFYSRVHDNVADTTSHGDPDVEVPLVGAAAALDANYSSGVFLSSMYSSYLQAWRAMLSDLGFEDLDDFLSSIDLNLHEDFNPVYDAVFGTGLDAINVFRKTPLNMGVLTMVSSGVGVFADGEALGTGSGTFDANSNSAGARLQAYVGSGTTTVSGLDLNLTVLKEDGSQQANVTANIAAGAAVGTTVDFGSATDKFLDVITLNFAGGQSGLVVGIRQIIERTPSL